MLYSGFAELRTPRDLLAKLRHDLQRMKSSPRDQYAAFDFFITAEHIVDWQYPYSREEQRRLRQSHPILRITSHLASGAKHFEAQDTRHKSVAHVDKQRYVEPGYVEEGYFHDPLVVRLTDQEAQAFGHAEEIDVIDLGDAVLKYWESRLGSCDC